MLNSITELSNIDINDVYYDELISFVTDVINETDNNSFDIRFGMSAVISFILKNSDIDSVMKDIEFNYNETYPK